MPEKLKKKRKYHPKLGKKIVEQLRVEYTTTTQPYTKIAAKFNIAPSTLHRKAKENKWIRPEGAPVAPQIDWKAQKIKRDIDSAAAPEAPPPLPVAQDPVVAKAIEAEAREIRDLIKAHKHTTKLIREYADRTVRIAQEEHDARARASIVKDLAMGMSKIMSVERLTAGLDRHQAQAGGPVAIQINFNHAEGPTDVITAEAIEAVDSQ